jgi:hypothetical protein
MDSDTPPDTALKAPKNLRWPYVVGLLLLLAAGGLWAYGVFDEPRGPPEATVEVDAGVPPPLDAGPPLTIDEGDALLGQVGGGLSAQPSYLTWLKSLGLRQVVAAAQLVSEGDSPRGALSFVSIAGPFAVREEPLAAPPPAPGKKKVPAPPGRLFIAPESYARYDEVTAAVTSLNAAALGDAWTRLRPYLQTAYGEIGRPGTSFDDTLTAAIRRLLLVRLPEGEVELVPEGAVYGFKDPELQAASKAEKHLLRMGPKNGRAIQAALRDFATHAKLDVGS